jgi:hypothetical protein
MESFQHGALESRLTWMSRHILLAWMPAIHAGMTEGKDRSNTSVGV